MRGTTVGNQNVHGAVCNGGIVGGGALWQLPQKNRRDGTKKKSLTASESAKWGSVRSHPCSLWPEMCAARFRTPNRTAGASRRLFCGSCHRAPRTPRAQPAKNAPPAQATSRCALRFATASPSRCLPSRGGGSAGSSPGKPERSSWALDSFSQRERTPHIFLFPLRTSKNKRTPARIFRFFYSAC